MPQYRHTSASDKCSEHKLAAMSQSAMPLTALEVLTRGRSPGAMPGRMWGKPLAQPSVPLKAPEPNATCADVATKLDQKTAKPPLDNNELDKSAASVLLVLQNESVIAHTTPCGSFHLGVLFLTCFCCPGADVAQAGGAAQETEGKTVLRRAALPRPNRTRPQE